MVGGGLLELLEVTSGVRAGATGSHLENPTLSLTPPLTLSAQIFSSEFCGNADMPFDFFMSRYKEAYVQETLAFVDSLVNDKPSPCSGEDGLIALVRRILAMHLP